MKQKIFNFYLTKILEAFSTTKEELFSNSRRSDLIDARHLLFYLCFNRPMRIIDINKILKSEGFDINHSVIIYGASAGKEKARTNRDYKRLVLECEETKI